MNSIHLMSQSHSTSNKKHVKFIESSDFSITYNYERPKSCCYDSNKRYYPDSNYNSSANVNKYSYIPGVSKMKHLSNSIIESLISREGLPKSKSRNDININSQLSSKTQSFPINLKANSHYLTFKKSKPKINPHKNSINSNILMKNNKLLFANMGVSKKRSLLQLATQSKEFSKSNTEDTISNDLFLQKGKIKRSSLVDRYVFKIANPDGVMEDYIIEEDKPGDKYKRFKNQIMKGKNKVYRLIQDVKRTQMISDTMISVYITRLKGNRFHRHNKTMSY